MATAASRAIFSKLSTRLLSRRIRFSSPFSSNASPNYHFSDFDSRPEGSSVYKHKLQFQRPATIQSKDWLCNSIFSNLCNSITLIGRVVFPLKTINNRALFGVHTMLEVKSPTDSFRILLKMWDKMAEIASQHLKEDDFIYISGRLGSYRKVDENGHRLIFFEVTVNELNYVASGSSSPDNQKFEKKELKGGDVSTSGASSVEERTRDRLYLWQVFFASPHEWWDNRKNKKHPRAPDFKHKDTGECLWLDPKDPPWVHRQLLLQDSRKAELGYRDNPNYRSRVSMWKYDG